MAAEANKLEFTFHDFRSDQSLTKSEVVSGPNGDAGNLTCLHKAVIKMQDDVNKLLTDIVEKDRRAKGDNSNGTSLQTEAFSDDDDGDDDEDNDEEIQEPPDKVQKR